MATNTVQGQDVVRCQLCTNAVEYHCNLCHIDICFNCIPLHMADRTKRHEVVDFHNRKAGPILPECKSHEKSRCDMYCKDCHEPMCILCVTTTHNRHDITDIGGILEILKQRIIADVKELESNIIPQYKPVDVCSDAPSTEFDDILSVIQDQEDNICKVVREIGRQLKDEVLKQKKDFERKKQENQSLTEENEKELNRIIQTSKSILHTNDAKRILSYQSKNEKYRQTPKGIETPFPIFSSGKIGRGQLQEMFGSLQNNSQGCQPCMQSLLPNPVVVNSHVQSPYGKNDYLWRILCEGTEKMWISGKDRKIHQIDRRGSILKSMNVVSDATTLSLKVKQELIFSLAWPDAKVYMYTDDVVVTMFDLSQWCPRGICLTTDNDLLMSMRSLDEAESKVVRYSGTKEIRTIQNDLQGIPLFSVGARTMLLLTENGNEDICVADYAGESVVVTNASGALRFKYLGNISAQSKYTSFKPLNIASDVKHQILINDRPNDIVHVIDSDGNFIRYLEYPCNGGLCVDVDRNLVVGEESTGKIQIIKHLL